MFSKYEFRAQMARQNFTQERLAKEIGMTPKTLGRKIKTGKFGTDEVAKIMEVLRIENPVPIFFAGK